MEAFKFNARAKSFSKINAHSLALLAKLAYQNKATIQKQLNEFGLTFQDHQFFQDTQTDTEGFIVSDNKKIIVSFRGTEPDALKDWRTDARIKKVIWQQGNRLGEVHRGFYKALASVWPQVEAQIIQLRNNNQSIWFTGHSLGGALATLAVATVLFQSSINGFSGLYTYGQPRIFDHELAKHFNKYVGKQAFRMVNNNDVVARVPPQVFGYSHIGTLKYFDHDGKLHSDGQLSWWARFWDRIEGRIEDLLDLSPDGIGDHDMSEYINNCQKNL